MTTPLQDRTVLVVGRGGGIARAVTLAVRDAGADVVVAGRNTDALTASYDDPAITVAHLDVTDEASVVDLADQLGSVDHVVTTASARARGRIADLDPDTVAVSLRTKVIGPMLLAKHFAPPMPADGSFVFFSGSTATRPTVGMLAVGATNAAVDLLVRGLAVELAPIRVNAVSPGTIDTGAYDALGAKGKAELFTQLTQRSPARRIGTADDIANAVLFALTNTFVTGASLPIDGGQTLV